MKKFYIIAAFLMASTAAHAGNSVSFEIDGKKIHIEAPKNCDQLSCIKISGQGLSGINLKGFKGFKSNDDDTPNNPPAPASAPTTPLGIWATEENKGNVRIEQCGQNLCGYAVNTGERILINMKPSDSKWTGQIHDPDSGKNYDSTIAMKGTNALKVQGCAFGGLFCGVQTWKRIS